jgi:hypothetical protein
MTKGRLSDAEAVALWREAGRRLRLVDAEPPLEMARVDALQALLGPRRKGEPLAEWLQRGRAAGAASGRPSAEIIHVDFGSRRFRPVAEIIRLAADTAGERPELPERELESTDGRFRLRVTPVGDEVVVAVQVLGQAADQFAGQLIAIAGLGSEASPVAVLLLDEDGDGEARIADSLQLRHALLRPLIGVLDEV